MRIAKLFLRMLDRDRQLWYPVKLKFLMSKDGKSLQKGYTALLARSSRSPANVVATAGRRCRVRIGRCGLAIRRGRFGGRWYPSRGDERAAGETCPAQYRALDTVGTNQRATEWVSAEQVETKLIALVGFISINTGAFSLRIRPVPC
jgi:hypothetical protein